MKILLPILAVAAVAGVAWWAWKTGKLATIGLTPKHAPPSGRPPSSGGGDTVTTNTGVTITRPPVPFGGTRAGF